MPPSAIYRRIQRPCRRLFSKCVCRSPGSKHNCALHYSWRLAGKTPFFSLVAAAMVSLASRRIYQFSIVKRYIIFQPRLLNQERPPMAYLPVASVWFASRRRLPSVMISSSCFLTSSFLLFTLADIHLAPYFLCNKKYGPEYCWYPGHIF